MLYEQLLDLLEQSKTYRDPNPSRSTVTGYEHALLAGTWARMSNAPEAEIVMALVHDLGRPIDDIHHGDVIADMMYGTLPKDCIDVLRHHGEFQSQPLVVLGEQYARKRWWRTALALMMWDALSFNENLVSNSLSIFIPMLLRITTVGVGEFHDSANL